MAIQEENVKCRVKFAHEGQVSDPRDGKLRLFVHEVDNHTFWYGTLEVLTTREDFAALVKPVHQVWVTVELEDGRTGHANAVGEVFWQGRGDSGPHYGLQITGADPLERPRQKTTA